MLGMSRDTVSRRQFCMGAGSAIAALVLGQGCGLGASAQRIRGGGRINARPKANIKTTATGARALGLDPARDAILQMPANVGSTPLPLLVLLHGAGGSAKQQLGRMGTFASDAGLVILAPDSRGQTWDGIRGDFGPDVTFLNRALEAVFDLVAVDAARVTIGGFSDGASYALSLGLINGNLFRRVLAFSPGFIVNGVPQGKPRVFMSHGKRDTILPIDQCSRVIAERLRREAHYVTYREFDGGHEIPPAIAEEGLTWAAAK